MVAVAAALHVRLVRAVSGVLALLCFAGMTVTLAVAQTAPVVALASRLESSTNHSLLIVDLTAPVTANAFVLSNPDRVVIDMPEVDFRMDVGVGRAVVASKTTVRPGQASRTAKRSASARAVQKSTGAPLIRAYRFGLFGPGRSRIVIDLAGPAKIIRAESVSVAGSTAARLTVELAPTDRTNFLAAVAQAEPMQPASAGAVLADAHVPDAGRPVIVLDPGHGGIDAGASGLSGSIEKIIVFEFARALAHKLEASGRYDVLLTRQDDRFVSLGDRVRIARTRHAALFVSIHADTLSDSAQVQGATIYTVSEKASDKEAARIADKENQADSIAGIQASDETSSVNDILFDLTRRETRAYSHLFARTLANTWQASGRLNKNPQRAAGFMVLKAPDVPSVLIELGYLSSHKDVAALESVQWREKSADAIARSIDQFFNGRDASVRSAGRAHTLAASDATNEASPARSDVNLAQ